MNKDFNYEIKVVLTVAYIDGEKNEALNMVEMGTYCGERIILPCRIAEFITNALETKWF